MSEAVSEEDYPPPASPASGRGDLLAPPTVAALLIVAVAIATRIVAWWNPVAHVDDQFYLLAGEELLKGHWPYVDVWDRKPLGLFLLYAGIAWIGGGSILGLNLIATAFAAATAMVIRQIALRFASPIGATLGALTYLLVIPLVGGQTGQSPVFYNLLMAGAAWLLFRAAERDRLRDILTEALGVMLLCGLAMTIKQISLVEGCYFGLAFLWLMHRRGASLVQLAAATATMIIVALLPTALTLLGYALAGREALDEYVYATFVSIFQKSGWALITKAKGLSYFLIHVALPLAFALVGARDRLRAGTMVVRDGLLFGWIAASIGGYLAIPHFFDHYAIPVIVPLCISAATFFDRPNGRLFFAACAFFYLIQPTIIDYPANKRARLEFARLNEAVERHRQGGCIYIGDGPTRLYSTTGACQVTRYLFPDHLNLVIETDSVGMNTAVELGHILDQRPAVIVTQDRKLLRYSAAYQHFLDRVRRDYRVVYETHRKNPRLVQGVVVWQRNDLSRSVKR